jgi:hypothetical protein
MQKVTQIVFKAAFSLSLFPLCPSLISRSTKLDNLHSQNVAGSLARLRTFCQHREPYAVFQGSIIGALQQEKKDYPNHYWWV